MPLIQFRLLPQKRKRVPSSTGSRPYSRRITDMSPEMPRLRSVLPHLIMIFLNHVASLSISKHLQNRTECLLLNPPINEQLTVTDLEHEFRRKIRTGKLKLLRRRRTHREFNKGRDSFGYRIHQFTWVASAICFRNFRCQ